MAVAGVIGSPALAFSPNPQNQPRPRFRFALRVRHKAPRKSQSNPPAPANPRDPPALIALQRPVPHNRRLCFSHDEQRSIPHAAARLAAIQNRAFVALRQNPPKSENRVPAFARSLDPRRPPDNQGGQTCPKFWPPSADSRRKPQAAARALPRTPTPKTPLEHQLPQHNFTQNKIATETGRATPSRRAIVSVGLHASPAVVSTPRQSAETSRAFASASQCPASRPPR